MTLLGLFLAAFDYDRAGENQYVFLAVGDVDAVGVGHGEPAFGDLGNRLAGAGEGVLVIGEIAGGFEIGGAVLV